MINKISQQRWTKAGSNLVHLSFVILTQSALVVVDWSSFTLSLIYNIRMSKKFIASVQSIQILQCSYLGCKTDEFLLQFVKTNHLASKRKVAIVNQITSHFQSIDPAYKQPSKWKLVIGNWNPTFSKWRNLTKMTWREYETEYNFSLHDLCFYHQTVFIAKSAVTIPHSFLLNGCSKLQEHEIMFPPACIWSNRSEFKFICSFVRILRENFIGNKKLQKRALTMKKQPALVNCHIKVVLIYSI